MFCGVCGGRESAAARKDICRVRCGTPPSPAATPPLAGEAAGAAATQKGSPARGAGCARRRRLRGALPVGSGNTPQGPAASCPAAHGGSARPRGGRDRPPYIAAENGQRSVNGRRFKARRRADASIGPYAGGGWRPGGCGSPEGPCPRVSQGVCGSRESAAARKGIGKARCGTPPPPAAAPPLTGEASGAAAIQKGSPARGAFQAAVCSKPPPQ